MTLQISTPATSPPLPDHRRAIDPNLRLRGLTEFGLGSEKIPIELQELHNFPPIDTPRSSYGYQTNLKEGPPWYAIEKKALAAVINFMGKVVPDNPVYEALKDGSIQIVPFERSIRYMNSDGTNSQNVATWSPSENKLYLDRRYLLENPLFTTARLMHEGTHALDPATKPPVGDRNSEPARKALARAEEKAFSSELDFTRKLRSYIEPTAFFTPDYEAFALKRLGESEIHIQRRLQYFRTQL